MLPGAQQAVMLGWRDPEPEIRWLIRDPDLRAVLGADAYVRSYELASTMTLARLRERGIYLVC